MPIRGLHRRRVTLLTGGNVSLQEHYALFEYLLLQLPLNTLVLSVVFDYMRETGIISNL
jgi:hypothetical protein